MARYVKKIGLTLTHEQWIEIYYALDDKLKRVISGELGRNKGLGEDELWAMDLQTAKARLEEGLQEMGIKY